MATVALSGIITPSNVVTTTSTSTLSNKTLVAPALGTPVSGNLSNCTGIPSPSAATPTALGTVYGKTNTTNLTFLGYGAGTANTGTYNTFIGGVDDYYGISAGGSNTSGNNNTAVGSGSIPKNVTGSNITSVGMDAGQNTTAGPNSYFGLGAGSGNTSGTLNVAVGYRTLGYTGAGGIMSNNVCVGDSSLTYNTTGGSNVAVGGSALLSNTTASNNTAIGYKAGFSNTTGASNTAVGSNALASNTTAEGNTAIGYYSFNSNTTGNYNSSLGQSSLEKNTTGTSNIGVGYQGLFNCTTGGGNIGIGGLSLAGVFQPVFNVTTENNRVVMGSTNVTNAYVQVAWTVVSDARDKTNFAPITHGLDFVKQLNPLSFQFKKNRETDIAHGPVRYGFKAQEILALEGNNPVIIDNEDSEKLRYNGEALVPVLVKALQELNAKFDAYVATHP